MKYCLIYVSVDTKYCCSMCWCSGMCERSGCGRKELLKLNYFHFLAVVGCYASERGKNYLSIWKINFYYPEIIIYPSSQAGGLCYNESISRARIIFHCN